jgi:hypothetical protein
LTSAEAFSEEEAAIIGEKESETPGEGSAFFSRETISELLRGNNKTLGVAIVILIILLCGGMLIVPSIWSILF